MDIDEQLSLRYEEHGGAARELLGRHRETWGDGPPYFSLATTAFWSDLRRSGFAVAKCSACDAMYFPPRVVCPECWAEDSGVLVEADGAGVVRSWTKLHVVASALAELSPLTIVVVDLDVDACVLAWMLDDEPSVGMRCRVRLRNVGRGPHLLAEAHVPA